jgi:hypothetical protein
MSDLWHVRMPNGEVRTLDVDQIDAGYHQGWIKGSTPVLPSGSFEWTTLAKAAGLEEEEPAPYSIAPMALEPTYDVDVDLASGIDASALRPRRWPWVLGFAAVTAFVAAAGFGGMKYAQRTAAASAPPPPPVVAAPAPTPAPAPAPSPVVAAPAPAPAPKAETPKATSAMSVADLPPAKKPLLKSRRK